MNATIPQNPNHLNPAPKRAIVPIVIACLVAWGAAWEGQAAPQPLLSLGATGGLSLAVEPQTASKHAIKLQISTNLSQWFDWKFITEESAPFALANEGLTNFNSCYFRAQPLSLSLSNWSLTLPVDSLRVGTPDEVFQPELATYQNPLYFHTNISGNGLVFNAPCGGATTTGSQYPRSELREMTSNGLAHASWSTTNGTHTFEVVQAINHLPVVKPQLVAAQIHNATGAVLTVRLQNHDLLLDRQGLKTTLSTNLYQLGTVFGFKLVAHNGQIDCYYNGDFVRSYPVTESDCYFKAGCYTQSNTNKGDTATAYGEVVIYGVEVKHEP